MHGWELAVIAAAVVGYSAVSGRLARSPLTPAVVFVTAGLLSDDRLPMMESAPATEHRWRWPARVH